MPGQVEHEHAVAPDELGQQLDPVARRPTEAVDEHERVACAAGEIPQPQVAGDEEALLERARCSRHAGTVSLADDGELGDAGPLIPAHDEQAVNQPA